MGRGNRPKYSELTIALTTPAIVLVNLPQDLYQLSRLRRFGFLLDTRYRADVLLRL